MWGVTAKDASAKESLNTSTTANITYRGSSYKKVSVIEGGYFDRFQIDLIVLLKVELCSFDLV